MKRPFVKKRQSGSARIVRDSYSNSQNSWWTIRDEVMKRDGGRCQARKAAGVCNAKASEVHHILPLSRGGTTTKSNLISLCKDCHDTRHGHLARSR